MRGTRILTGTILLALAACGETPTGERGAEPVAGPRFAAGGGGVTPMEVPAPSPATFCIDDPATTDGTAVFYATLSLDSRKDGLTSHASVHLWTKGDVLYTGAGGDHYALKLQVKINAKGNLLDPEIKNETALAKVRRVEDGRLLDVEVVIDWSPVGPLTVSFTPLESCS